MENVLELNNVEVVYNRTVQVLRGLSLNVSRGTITVLLGSNGAGKSTALNAISGLLALEHGDVVSGKITFNGSDITHAQPHELVHSGLFHVMEGRHVFEDLSVEENLIAASFGRRETAAGGVGFDEVYEYFPALKERRHGLAGYLSGGEQQMLAIGRALVVEPDLILLDEPTLGLAPMFVEEIFEIITRINREQGTALLMVEQNAAMALMVASYGYIMENGKIVIDGPPEKLIENQDVQEFYLGAGESRSYRDIKHYKRRKRWLS